VSAPEPALLRADNFTPPSRTPWGGERILRDYKREHLPARAEQRVGESWEVSVEPDFPARLEDGRLLSEYIAAHPQDVLGGEAERAHDGTALLVKLIDAREPLSVQIHPADDYLGLANGEGGKPESWYVLEREPGAGLYLGFVAGTQERDVRAALHEGRTLEPLLRFVPVEPGDFFLIDAGTPHAIGGGLTLVEPQYVTPGRRGVTYRYWDWNRRYDALGRPDPAGSARPLHVEHALAVTAWERVRTATFVESIRVRAGAPDVAAPASVLPLAGAGALPSAFLQVVRLAGTGSTRLPALDRMLAITVVAGSLRIGDLQVERGRSAVVPARLGGAPVELVAAHAIVSAVT
jgi:mannose-6-phosphate isomerase class I